MTLPPPIDPYLSPPARAAATIDGELSPSERPQTANPQTPLTASAIAPDVQQRHDVHDSQSMDNPPGAWSVGADPLGQTGGSTVLVASMSNMASVLHQAAQQQPAQGPHAVPPVAREDRPAPDAAAASAHGAASSAAATPRPLPAGVPSREPSQRMLPSLQRGTVAARKPPAIGVSFDPAINDAPPSVPYTASAVPLTQLDTPPMSLFTVFHSTGTRQVQHTSLRRLVVGEQPYYQTDETHPDLTTVRG